MAAEPAYVICKFGGTSVATPQGRAALISRVRAHRENGRQPLVVVSALGRRPQPYATDTLLDLVADLPPDARERDQLASLGEIIAAVLVAHELRAAGINARAFTGAQAGIITTEDAANARITHLCPDALTAAAAAGTTPVVCGFQGISPTGHTTTLGRGGSDTTACALGVALGATAVELYSDVDGVMTADPRVVSDARVIDTLHPDELFQLVRMGSRIVHTPAAELALASGAALLVKNTFTTHDGTRVCDLTAPHRHAAATAIAGKTNITRFSVALAPPTPPQEAEKVEEPVQVQQQAAIYRALAAAAISLDMFTPAGTTLLFTVDAANAAAVRGELDRLHLDYVCEESLAKVTVVGSGMHGVPGVMARIAEALAAAGIDIKQTADSHTTISVLVAAEQAGAAQCALHAAFDLDKE